MRAKEGNVKDRKAMTEKKGERKGSGITKRSRTKDANVGEERKRRIKKKRRPAALTEAMKNKHKEDLKKEKRGGKKTKGVVRDEP